MKPLATDRTALPRGAWYRFWFMPTDPTTLGLMRIVTGLLVIYVHLAYCFDLQEFFGPRGYWDIEAANQERKESPVTILQWKTGGTPMTISTPQLTDRRDVIFDFLRQLPSDTEGRNAALAYLYTMIDKFSHDQPNLAHDDLQQSQWRQALIVLRNAGRLLQEQRDKEGEILARAEYDAPALPLSLPDFFVSATREERMRYWAEALVMLPYMPADANKFMDIILWLEQMGSTERQIAADWLKKLPPGAEGAAFWTSWRNGVKIRAPSTIGDGTSSPFGSTSPIPRPCGPCIFCSSASLSCSPSASARG